MLTADGLEGGIGVFMCLAGIVLSVCGGVRFVSVDSGRGAPSSGITWLALLGLALPWVVFATIIIRG